MENTNPTPNEQSNQAYQNPPTVSPVTDEASPQTGEVQTQPTSPVGPQNSVVAPTWTPSAEAGQMQSSTAPSVEDAEHNYLLSVAFSYFFGGFGVDRFYLGYTATGVLKLLTFGGLGIWHLVDMLLIAFGKKKAKGSQLPLEGYEKHHKAIKMVAIILLIVNALVLVGVVLMFVLTFLSASSLQQHSQDVQLQLNRQQQLQQQQNTNSGPSYYTN